MGVGTCSPTLRLAGDLGSEFEPIQSKLGSTELSAAAAVLLAPAIKELKTLAILNLGMIG